MKRWLKVAVITIVGLPLIFFLLFILVILYALMHSGNYEEIAHLTALDGSQTLVIINDYEDDPYYRFELRRNFGLSTTLAKCQSFTLKKNGERVVIYYKPIRWLDSHHFLLQVNWPGKPEKVYTIDTKYPSFPCKSRWDANKTMLIPQ